MPELPSGTVTFLFTDVEGSTELLRHLGGCYAHVLSTQHELLRRAFTDSGGREVDAQGDALFFVFASASEAVRAAAAGQRAIAAHAWPDGVEVKVRMGVHSGRASVERGHYTGLAVHRAARICAAAHGGQLIASQTTCGLLEDEGEDLEGVQLRDLGEQRLKDFEHPVRLYQLDVPGLPTRFPPRRTLGRDDQEPLIEIGPLLRIRLGRVWRRWWRGRSA